MCPKLTILGSLQLPMMPYHLIGPWEAPKLICSTCWLDPLMEMLAGHLSVVATIQLDQMSQLVCRYCTVEALQDSLKVHLGNLQVDIISFGFIIVILNIR